MFNFRWLYLLLNLHQFLFQSFAFSNGDYCQLNCEETVNDELRVVRNSGCYCKPPAPNCTELVENQDEFRTWMVDVHNELRHKFALGLEEKWPYTAANMHTISYDLSLEYIARCYLGQCIFEHGKCFRTPNFESVGQTILFTPGELIKENEIKKQLLDCFSGMDYMRFDGNITKLLDKFEDKYREYLLNQIYLTCATQLIWAKTTHIGCAQFYNANVSRTYLLCNYGPAGNIDGKPILLRGKPCSKCDKNEKCSIEYPGLCDKILHVGKSNNTSHLASELLILISLLVMIYIY